MCPKMSAIGFYITTCRYVVQCNPREPESWAELERYLPFLRQALSCCVCAQIIHNPMGPPHTVCHHNVCSDCLGGKMRLKPSCSWCKNHDEFVENAQLRLIVQCFKKLCEYMASSAIAATLANANNGGTNALMAIIQEGVAVKDTVASPAMTNVGLFPPVLPTVLPGVGMKRKRRCRKRNFLKVKANFGDNEHGRGSSLFPKSCPVSRQNDSSTLNSQEDDNLPSTTVHCEDSKEPYTNVIDIKERKYDHNVSEVSQQSLSSTGELNRLSAEKASEQTLPDSTVNTFMEQSHRDLYSTVAAEHDYINKDMPKEEENKIDKSKHIAKHIMHKVRKSENCHIGIVKKAKIEAHFDKSGTNMKTVGSSDEGMLFQPKVKATKNNKKGKEGCRCGLATPNPGKLTCCGQRCPCYSAFKGCVDCRCRGCRNPRGDPAKIPQLMQPLIRVQDIEESDIDVDIKID